MRALGARLARGVLALGLLVTLAGCGGGPRPEPVTIMVPWSGDEFTAFYTLIKGFEAATHTEVAVEVTRAQPQQLDAAVAAGHPPDLAVLSSPGAVAQYADEGALQPLGDVRPSDYVQPFQGLMTVRQAVYAVPVKADVQSLVWYDPKTLPDPPGEATPAALKAFSARQGRWCLGLESGATSGWPGADWISDILLTQQQPDGYRKWLTGGTAWSSPTIRGVWNEWGDLIRGSTGQALETGFGKAAAAMSARSAGCRLAHGALAALDAPAATRGTRRPAQAYRYVPLPKGAPLQVSADFVGMFTTNPRARDLITYLSDVRVQRAWTGDPDSFAVSASAHVPLGSYPRYTRQVAGLLQPRSGHPLCFSAADMMQPDLSAAFYRAVLRYVEDPGALPQILAGLDMIQKAVMKDSGTTPTTSHDTLVDKACSTPAPHRTP